MAFVTRVTQLATSLRYRLAARTYRRSPAWQAHPHNRPPQPARWKDVHAAVEAAARNGGIPFDELRLRREEFQEFTRAFPLPPWSLYALRCREKKLMEHHIAFRLLGLRPGQRYIDIASENSPFPEVARKRAGVDAYSQDLSYPPGVRGRQIGSNAAALPIEAAWADAASLHCAFEHFAGDADSGFIREMARVLKPGGKCVIVPLYVGPQHLNLYDPLLPDGWDVTRRDPGATVVAEIELGGHFERVYAPETLSRILIPGLGLSYHLFHVTGAEDAFTTLSDAAREMLARIRFVLLIEKDQRSGAI